MAAGWKLVVEIVVARPPDAPRIWTADTKQMAQIRKHRGGNSANMAILKMTEGEDGKTEVNGLHASGRQGNERPHTEASP